jgi:signal transduction histidine kinase
MAAGNLNRSWEVPRLEIASARLTGEVRLGFVLVAILMELSARGRWHGLTLALLLVYALYAVLQLQLVRRERGEDALGYAHWVDAAAYAIVSTLSGGLTSRYMIFLLFPVLAASSRGGWRAGVTVALACVLWFATVEALEGPLQLSLELDELSLTSGGFLLLAGLMIARWGHSERTLKRRLALVTDVNRLFSPRHALDYALHRLIWMLRAYQGADTGVLIIKDARSGGWLLHKVDSEAHGTAARAEPVRAELAQALLALAPAHAAVYARGGMLRRQRSWRAYDCATMEAQTVDEADLARVANLLETDSFMTLPIRSRSETIGRVYLTSRDAAYRHDDLRFLNDVMAHAGMMIENMQLVERLAQEVASDERKRISRDLHDATIQPYIGLKLGIEALHRRVTTGDPLKHEIDDLVKIADDGIFQLRSYVGSLKSAERRREKLSLLPAVRRQAEKFSEFYGIDAEVHCEGDILVEHRLYEEIVHIVREGLSNMRRHTSTERAVINLREVEGHLLLEFVNDAGDESEAPPAFFPRSIGERAAELGGRVRVERQPAAYTVVAVDIPL